jgi:hypothetical protein
MSIHDLYLLSTGRAVVFGMAVQHNCRRGLVGGSVFLADPVPGVVVHLTVVAAAAASLVAMVIAIQIQRARRS